MGRLILASNRLPYQVEQEDGDLVVTERVGGFATGLTDFYDKHSALWVGWAGQLEDELADEERQTMANLLLEKGCHALFLSRQEEYGHYHGFCNNTLWPLFHYYSESTQYSETYWETYLKVNQKFADHIMELLQEDDLVWIHDYHLLLVPGMIRKHFPDVSIGFFLHINFPSYELFRLLPWRKSILRGLLGADLIGFHTYDYERHFLSCVSRLLGHDTEFNRIRTEERIIKVDFFPMGIDVDKFQQAVKQNKSRKVQERSKIQHEIIRHHQTSPGRKLVLSVGILDYSKGLPQRLLAFEHFLEHYPEYHEQVTFVLATMPFRDYEHRSRKLKSQIDELVGRINGKYGIINWTPIWYFYRKFAFDNLVELYSECDIAMIAPIRDGMNLVAKEYVACKTSGRGVLILSEMAGAAKEMSEALIVNPNNQEEMSTAIYKALQMPIEEQIARNRIMQDRLKRYNEAKWANDFIGALQAVKQLQQKKLTARVNELMLADMAATYRKAKQRIILLDYDGTLCEFVTNPKEAKPDDQLYLLLQKLTDDPLNQVVIISGRDRETLSEWFPNWNMSFIAEHGVWDRSAGGQWRMAEAINRDWMEIMRPGIEFYVDRTPRSFIEEKNYSLVWHYRDCDPDLGSQRAWELKEELKSMVANLNLEIMTGDKVIEIKTAGINKGRAAQNKMGDTVYDFVLAIGDDWTDEYTFGAMPPEAFTIKVGTKSTKARYYVETVRNVHEILLYLNREGERL